ncbi:MAG: nitroreductase family protein [candidate division NC10 bacterium]|nr:nitroreductase family protein [candidate division NC10 bacterium]
MEKPAVITYPIHDLVRRRWSPVGFADRPVEREKLLSLFEAARWAASSFNEQPWRFIVCPKNDAEAYGRLLGCLVPQNVAWAQHAPVLMLTVAKLRFSHNDLPNRHAWHDVGQAIATLLVQATALGLHAHQMAGFDAARARGAFGIPDGFEPVAAVALGYLGDPQALPEPLKEREFRPRQRKPLNDMVFGGRWSAPSLLLGG